jgi:hypothetical protein
MSSRTYQRDLAEHLGRWRFVRDARARWDREARIDRDYEAGKIWTEQELLRFAARNQTATRYQVIRPTINLVCGLEAQNRSDLKVLPRTEAHIDSAEARTKLTKMVTDVTQLGRQYSIAFRDTCIVGAGWVEEGYNPDPAAAIRIKIQRVAPELIYRDPAGTEQDLSRDLDIFRALWMRGEDLARLFPKFKKDILAMCGLRADGDRSIESWSHSSDASNANGGQPPAWGSIYAGGGNYGQQLSDHDMGIDRHRGQVQAVERWYRTYESQDYVRFKDGRVVEVTDENVQQLAQHIVAGECGMPMTGTFAKMRVAVFAGEILLSDSPTPFKHDRFPFTPLWAYEDEYGQPCGIVRGIRDPAKEYNARRTSMLRKVMQQQYLVEPNAVGKGGVDRMRRALASNESLIELGDNGLAGFKALERGDTLQVEADLLNQAKDEIKSTSGVVPELLGEAARATSGIGIQRLQQQGETGLYTLFDNRNWALKTTGEKLQSLIAETFTDEMAVRITDTGRGIEFLKVNQKQPDGSIANDITQDAFDVVLSLDNQSDTNSLARLEAMNAFLANADPAIKLAFAPEVAKLGGLGSDVVPKLEQLADQLLQRILGPQPGGAPPPGAPGPQVPPGPPPGAPAPSVETAPHNTPGLPPVIGNHSSAPPV